MNDILNTIQLIDKQAPNAQDLVQLLYNIQKTISTNFIKDIPKTESPNLYIKLIWDFLLKTSTHESLTVQNALQRTISIFLMKFYPYYPLIFQNFLYKASVLENDHPRFSLFLCSVFSFVAPLINPPRDIEFINLIEIYPHFTKKDQTISEYLPQLINKVASLPESWHKELLILFLQNDVEQYQMKSVLQIIINYPPLLFYVVSHKKLNLTLVSFLFSSLNIYDQVIPTMPHLFEDFPEATSVASIDNYLNIFSRCCDCELCDNEFTISTHDGNTKCTVPVEKIKDRAAFYQFKLPIDYLKPSSDDGILILTTKFSTLSSRITELEEINEIFEIFYAFLDKDYDECTSSCLQSFPKCLKVFYEHCDKDKIVKIVRSIVLMKNSSWFQKIDIANIISNMSQEMILACFGRNGLEQLLETLLDFLLIDNESLFSAASNAVISISTHQNYEFIFDSIMNRVDPFNSFNVQRTFQVLLNIIDKYGVHDTMYHLAGICLELIPYHQTDLITINRIVSIIIKFDLNKYPKEALSILESYAQMDITAESYFIQGKHFYSPIASSLVESHHKIINEDIDSRDIDLTSPSFTDYFSIFPSLFYSIKCLTALPVNNKSFVLSFCDFTIYFAPKETFELIKHYWSKLNQNEMSLFMVRTIPYLSSNPDLNVAANLCKLFVGIRDQAFKEVKTQLISVFSELRNIVFQNNIFLTAEIIAPFVVFHALYSSDNPTLLAFINSLEDTKKNFVLRYFNQEIPIIFSKFFDPKYFQLDPLPQTTEDQESSILPEEEIHFTCPTIKMSILKEESDDVYFSLTQINYDIREESKERLCKYINYFLGIYDFKSVFLVLKYAALKNIDIDFASYNFQDTPFENMKYPDCMTKESTYENLDYLYEMSHFDDYMKELKAKEKVKGKEMIRFLKVLNRIVNFDKASELLDFAVHNLSNHSSSLKKMSVALSIIQNATFFLQVIPEESISQMLNSLPSSEDMLPMWNTTTTIRFISVKCPPDTKFGLYIRKVCSYFNNNKQRTIFADLFLASMRLSPGTVTQSAINEIVQLCLSTDGIEQPTICKSGFKILEAAITIYPTLAPLFIKSNLSTIINRLKISQKHHTILEASCIILQKVFSANTMESFRPTILKSLDQFLPSIDSADFIYFIEIFPQLLLVYADNPKMITIVERMARTPRFFKVFIDSLKEKYSQFNTGPVSEEITDKWLGWLQNCKDYDCYNFSDQLSAWTNVSAIYSGIDTTLTNLSYQISIKAPRFFPAFVTIIKFIKEYGLLDIKNESLLKDAMSNATLITQIRCHKAAFMLVAESIDNLKTALDLACFENDCEESDLILNSLPPFEEEL